MKNKKLNVIVLLIAVLMLVLSVAITTYAIYRSSATGTSELKTAEWSIKLNGDSINTSNTFNFNLSEANWTHQTEINSTSTTIAPGSVGTYGLQIDTTGTEVDVRYEVGLVVKQNNTEVDLKTINPNLSVELYQDDDLQNNPLKKNITAGTVENLEIRITWNNLDDETSNNLDKSIDGENFAVEVTVVTKQQPLPMPVCRRATELNTEKCNNDGCRNAGIQNNTDITYGNLGTPGEEPVAGDAFDCDLTGDGNFNERFYYLSDYYDTHTLSFDSDTAVLIYSKTVSNGNTGTDNVAYASVEDLKKIDSSLISSRNYYGPITAVKHLPTTNTWENVSLKQTKRVILGENQSTHNSPTADNKLLPTNFSYVGKAARLPQVQEIFSACNVTQAVSFMSLELTNCKFLFENTYFALENSNISGFWTENPRASVTDTAIYINSYNLSINKDSTANLYHGLKPVIDVPKDRLIY